MADGEGGVVGLQLFIERQCAPEQLGRPMTSGRTKASRNLALVASWSVPLATWLRLLRIYLAVAVASRSKLATGVANRSVKASGTNRLIHP